MRVLAIWMLGCVIAIPQLALAEANVAAGKAAYASCAACHGALKQEAGLRLDAARLIREGGDSGEAIKVGDAVNSLLLHRVASEDPEVRMPPEGEGEQLTPEQLHLLREWVNAGAIAPQDEVIPTAPTEHWAYQLPVKAAMPSTDNADWQTNPIDAFIAQQQADEDYLEAKVDIGAYFAIHKGLSDVGDAAAAMALFDGSASSLNRAVVAIDDYHQDALSADGGFLLPLIGVLDDPFSG